MGALLPSSGGDYAFYLVAGRPYGEYGDVPAFLFAWTLFFMDPATTTIQGLTFAAYVLSLPYPDCAPPYEVKVLVTCLFITFATAVNCFSVKTSTKVQDVLSGLKNAINCVAEEVKNPGRNIPIAIAVSVALTATIYLLTNLAFFVVLDTDTIASADAVAVTFVRATWGQRMANVMPVVIGMTVFGTTCANVVTSSRVFFAASRQGHLARVMSYVHVDSSVPLLAMVVRCLLSLAFTLVGSVHFLIEVSILLGNVLDAASVASLLLLRRSMPDAPRPYRVPTVIAVLRLVVCLVLAAMTLVQVRRYVYQYALVAIAFATGAVYYYLFVRKKFRLRGCERIAVFLQKCFKSAPCSNELERLDDSVVVEWK
ncbi:hypothetical protein HPB52_012096 [Rhipicephalus sanguineus]|uniref:Amino acid transporter n=1 Tax=Rhipicephalus sanguineus TaxID=34632 RepID=A0A9D4PFA1_RHISA|nr:hypothetical protein HPB52_012096 [Rhipicephalus sanguineus]